MYSPPACRLHPATSRIFSPVALPSSPLISAFPLSPASPLVGWLHGTAGCNRVPRFVRLHLVQQHSCHALAFPLPHCRGGSCLWPLVEPAESSKKIRMRHASRLRLFHELGHNPRHRPGQLLPRKARQRCGLGAFSGAVSGRSSTDRSAPPPPVPLEDSVPASELCLPLPLLFIQPPFTSSVPRLSLIPPRSALPTCGKPLRNRSGRAPEGALPLISYLHF